MDWLISLHGCVLTLNTRSASGELHSIFLHFPWGWVGSKAKGVDEVPATTIQFFPLLSQLPVFLP